MAVGSAAAELKVLISFLQDGNGLKTILGEVKDLAKEFLGIDGSRLKDASENAEKLHPPIKHAHDELSGLDETLHKIGDGLKFLAGGFLALESVRFLKDLGDVAARAEVLSTVLHVVGNNAGYSTEQLDKTDQSVQRLGITATASRQSLAQFVQAGFDLNRATELARVAQDAAVILGVNSSEAFQRLTTAAQTRNTLMLRSMGIIVSADQAEQHFAQSMSKTASQLTIQEKSFAFLDAEIREGQKISGAYTEAMNDVGKQLTSLDRLTDNLKESLGKNLLPAYLALVEEFSLFLEQSRLVSDEYGSQGEGAQRLGETVRFLASSLREIALFFEEHVRIIGTAITVWAAFRVILIPVARILASLAAGEGLGALGAGVASVTALLGPLGVAIAAVSIGLVGWLSQTESGRREMSLFFAQLQAGSQGAIGIFHTLVATMQAGLKSIADLILHPFTADSFIGPWKEWANYVKSQIDEVRDYWNYTKKEFTKIMEGDKIDKKEGVSPNLQAELDKTRGELATAEKNSLEAKRQVERVKSSNDSDEIKAATDNLNKMKDEENKLAVKYGELVEGPGMTEAHRKVEEDRLNEARRRKAITDSIIELEGARTLTPGFLYDAKGIETSKAFDVNLGAINSKLKVFKANVEEAKVPTDELVRSYTEAGKAVKTAGDLKALTLAVQDLKDAAKQHPDPKDVVYIPPSVIASAQRALETAGIQNEKFALSQTSEIDARRKSLFDSAEAGTSEHLKHQLDLTKLNNQQQEDLDKEAFEHGLLSLDQYYDARKSRILTESAGELQVAKQALAALEDERKKGLVRGVEADAQSKQKIQAAKDTIEKTQQQGVVALVGNEQARIKAGTSLNDQVTALREEYDAYYGGLTEAIDQVREKWRKKALQLGDVPGAAEEVVRGIKLDIDKAILEFTNRQQQVVTLQEQADAFYGGVDTAIKAIRDKSANLRAAAKEGSTPGITVAIDRLETLEITKAKQDDQNKGLQVELGVKQSLLSLDRARLEAAKDNGDITSQQYTIRSNALLVEEIQSKQLEITVKEKELALNKEILAQEQARNQIVPDDQKHDLSGLERDITSTEGQLYKLDGEVVTLTTRITDYGKQLRKVFTESLATAISDSIQNVRNAGQSFIAFGNALKKNIGDAFGANISEKVTQYIVQTTSKKDEAGKAIPGTSVFDNVFKMLGLSPKDTKNDGSTLNKALWVRMDPGTSEGEKEGGFPLPGINYLTGSQNPTTPDWNTYGDKWWYGANGQPTSGQGIGDSLANLAGVGLRSSALPQGVNTLLSHSKELVNVFKNLFGGSSGLGSSALGWGAAGFAKGGELDGPGTGTSDSIPIMASKGEYIVPADKTQIYRPMLDAMRSGRLTHFAMGGMVDRDLHSIAFSPTVPRRYVGGGVVVADAGASTVTPASGGSGNMMVQLHPDAMNMTMRDWLEREVVRQHGRR